MIIINGYEICYQFKYVWKIIIEASNLSLTSEHIYFFVLSNVNYL